MFLTIRTTHSPARDLGYLLHKNPDRVHVIAQSAGNAFVFFPEATEEACTAALMLELDPVGLVRGRGQGDGLLSQYVNDRPFVASSFLSVALGKAFSTAMTGRCKERPELAAKAIDWEVTIGALPSGGGEAAIRALFEPLGYAVEAQAAPLDGTMPAWGDSRYFKVTLCGRQPLKLLLAHLYTLMPVLDNEKHYWVGPDELEKLLRAGAGWLESHPEKEMIAHRYLKYQRKLALRALEQLREAEAEVPAETVEDEVPPEEVERKRGLHDQRLDRVAELVAELGVASVLDLGCGEGKLLRRLLKNKNATTITGVDVSMAALERAKERLRLDRMPMRQRERLTLLQGSAVYRDERFANHDVAALVEVIEHIDPPRLAALERVVFEFAQPRAAIVTTPNAEYNVRYEQLDAGTLRHGDHRFEWDRPTFADWCRGVAARHGYTVALEDVGEIDPEVGAPSQLALFRRAAAEESAAE